MTLRWYTVVATRGDILTREFEVEATHADEARLMIERELAGEWEWDEMHAEEIDFGCGTNLEGLS